MERFKTQNICILAIGLVVLAGLLTVWVGTPLPRSSPSEVEFSPTRSATNPPRLTVI